MKPNIRLLLLITLFMHFYSPLISIADDFYVESDGNNENNGSEAAPWETIQGAIDNDAVEDGDTIYVGSGTFTENINVNKSVKIYGNKIRNPVISAADSSDRVFDILSDYVEIRYLIINGDNDSEAAGVYVNSGINDFSISYCELTDNEYGIYLTDTEDAVIYNNEFGNNNTGIYLSSADGSEITYNDFQDNTVGIYLVLSEIDSIYSNDFEGGNYGIYLKNDDEYYNDDDVSQLEDDNSFDEIDEANVYLSEEDSTSCFINTLGFDLTWRPIFWGKFKNLFVEE